MQGKITKKVTVMFAILSVMSLAAGCAHMEPSPPERKTGYAYLHQPLPEASRKVDQAIAARKDLECWPEFKAAKDTVDKAYEIYIACRTQEGIAMAQDGINKLNALCPKSAQKQAAPAPPPPAPTASIAVTPDSVKQGKCATINWSTTNATKVSIDNGVGDVDLNGSREVCPATTTKYTITAVGVGVARMDAKTVTVIPLKPKTVVFDEVALFDFDKAVLKTEGKEQIKAYREEAKAEFSRADKIKITGHTDNVGAAEYNMKLSLKRAEAVRDYLISIGVDANKLEVAGAGMTSPVADNSTKEGRAKNRRVEVDIYGLEK